MDAILAVKNLSWSLSGCCWTPIEEGVVICFSFLLSKSAIASAVDVIEEVFTGVGAVCTLVACAAEVANVGLGRSERDGAAWWWSSPRMPSRLWDKALIFDLEISTCVEGS